MNVNNGKLNEIIEDSEVGCTFSYKPRKWHSNPIGARRYQEMVNKENQKDSLSQMLLKNISETKRNVSELIEKGKMAEWLKRNCIKSDITATFDSGGFGSDSGISLCTSMDKDYSQDSLKANSDNDFPNKWNVDCDKTVSPNVSNNVEEVFTNNLTRVNQRGNNYEDLKGFYTPRSCYGEVGGLKAKDHILTSDPGSYPKRSLGGTLSSSKLVGTKRIEKSPDLLTRPHKTLSFSSDIVSENSDGVFRMSKSVDLSAKYNSTGENLVKVEKSADVLDNTVACTEIAAKKSVERAFRPGEEDLPAASRSVSGVRIPQEMKDRTTYSSSPKDYTGITKTLVYLAQMKRSNKNAISNFLQDVAGSSDEQLVLTDSQNPDTDQDAVGNQATGFSGNKLSNESVKYNTSTESLKWNFPNSNRKREEKLRSIGKEVAEYDSDLRSHYTSDEFFQRNKHSNPNRSNFESVSRRGQSQTNLFSEINSKSEAIKSDFKITYATQKYTSKVCDEKSLHSNTKVSETDIFSLASNLKVCGGDGKLKNGQNIREMNTQAALIYLSETLIESAQRAEMLLMQKMKEYNDLVCRDPPENRRQDFTCQVQITDSRDEPTFDIKLNEVQDKFLQELNDKNKKIRKLETEKKKLRKVLKKLNLLPGKKREGTEINKECPQVIGDSTTPRSISSKPPTLKETDENQGEFVQALKIENNLLHTLLKEMKAELDQENATILSLAKKLESSLGKQPHFKSRQQTDVVRKLEDKLEQQEKMLKQEAMEARAVAKYVIMKYKKLIQEYKQKVKSHQETVDKLTNAIK